ncbi:MAG: nitrilase-related carbon-nitrogen hydrolase, partial [Pseudomonadota bacterium]
MDKPASLRLCVVQMAMRPAASAEAFYDRLERFTAIAADYGAAAVLFPEYVTMPLASVGGPLCASRAIEALSAETETLRARLSALAVRHQITVFGGSHLARDGEGRVRNTTHVALPDGSLFAQQKIQPTPDERAVWGVEGGDRLAALDTPFGKAGVLICYDA